MAGYQGYSLESDADSSKQVNTGSKKGNGTSVKNNTTGSGRSIDTKDKNKSSKKDNYANSMNSAKKNKSEKTKTDSTFDLHGTIKKSYETMGKAVGEFVQKTGEKIQENKKQIEEKNKKDAEAERKRKAEEEKRKQEIQEAEKKRKAEEEKRNEEDERRRQEIQEEEQEANQNKQEDEKLYKSQDEWLLSFLKINTNNKSSIREISDSEREEIISKMDEYWKNNTGRELSLEYLVNGAVVNCTCGNKLSKIRGKDHGVYTDSSEKLALLNSGDTVVSNDFGKCSMTGYKCQYLDLEWQNVSNVEIGAEGKKALTMNSTLMCFCSEKTPPPKANPSNATKSSETKRSNKPKIIRPVTSGQEFTIASDVFIYPKFIKGDTHSYFDEQYWENTYSFVQTASSDVDMTVIKKLAIRSRMNKYEKLWIKYIGRYLIGCEDADMIRKILNIFYEIPEQGVIAIEKECKLSERFTDIFKEIKRCFDIIIQNYGNKKVLKKIGLWKVDIVAISGRNYMTLFRLSQEKVMTLRDGHLDTNPIEEAKYVFSKYGGISKFYDGGLMIRYGIVTLDSMNSKLVTQSISSNGGYAYYPGSAIVPRSIYSSTLAEGNGKVIDDLWIYFGKRDDKSFFVTMLALNVGVTIAIAAIPFLPLVVGGTAITTFTGSVIIPTGASILWTITSSIIAENMSDEEKNKFEQYRYTQNRAALSSVFEELKLNIVYSSIDNDYTSFSYMIFPSGETENLISIFVKNISDIYVDYYDNGDKNKYKSILSILGIENISQGDIYYKISLLVQSLTIEYIQERNYYVNGEENAAAIDGVDFINKIGKLKVSTTGNRQKVIKCYKKYSENGYIEIENLKGFKEYFEFSEGGFDEK